MLTSIFFLGKTETGAHKIKIKKKKDPKPGEERNFVCKECGRGYDSVKYLESHITKYHPEESSLNEFMTKEVPILFGFLSI